jgi:hypothetical protein
LLQTTNLPDTNTEVSMRLLLSNAFLSIVSNPLDASTLTVRASRAGDIETVFGRGFEVVTLPGHVYPFRAFIPRRIVADTIAANIFHINYRKFRDAVVDAPLYDAARPHATDSARRDSRGHANLATFAPAANRNPVWNEHSPSMQSIFPVYSTVAISD